LEAIDFGDEVIPLACPSLAAISDAPAAAAAFA